jgi:hypothetical protein
MKGWTKSFPQRKMAFAGKWGLDSFVWFVCFGYLVNWDMDRHSILPSNYVHLYQVEFFLAFL